MDNRSIPLRHSEFLYVVTYNFSKVLFFTFDYQDFGKFAKKKSPENFSIQTKHP